MLGVANSYTREVRIDGKLCYAVADWWQTGDLSKGAMLGLIVIGHEAAHMRGVHNESTANCAGVNFAYRYMKRNGTFKRYDERKIAFELVSNKDWPPAYTRIRDRLITATRQGGVAVRPTRRPHGIATPVPRIPNTVR